MSSGAFNSSAPIAFPPPNGPPPFLERSSNDRSSFPRARPAPPPISTSTPPSGPDEWSEPTTPLRHHDGPYPPPLSDLNIEIATLPEESTFKTERSSNKTSGEDDKKEEGVNGESSTTQEAAFPPSPRFSPSNFLVPPDHDSCQRASRAPNPETVTNEHSKLKSGDATERRLEDSNIMNENSDRESPPQFTNYSPELHIHHSGNVTCHDAHLNEDSEALFQFIKNRAEDCHSFSAEIHGSHQETRVETYTETVNGVAQTRTRTHQVTVTDFAFSVPVLVPQDPTGRNSTVVRDPRSPKGIVYSIAGDVPAYRGGTWEEVDAATIQPSAQGSREGRGEKTVDLEAGVETGRPSEDLRKSVSAERYPPSLTHVDVELGQMPNFVEPEQAREPNARARRGKGTVRLRGNMKKEGKSRSAKEEERELCGLPGWYDLSVLNEPNRPPTDTLPALLDGVALLHDGHVDLGNMAASQTTNMDGAVRFWCGEFTSCKAPFKEFKVEKQIFGFDRQLAETLVIANIRMATHYSHSISLTWSDDADKIAVRPDSTLSRVFSLNVFFKFLLWLALGFYPIMLALRKFWLGARFYTIRIGYPTQEWKPIHGSESVLREVDARQLLREQWTRELDSGTALGCRSEVEIEATLLVSPGGWYGRGWWYKDGFGHLEWIHRWQDSINMGVSSRKCSGTLKAW